jgi:hypothetical protein
MSSLDNAVEEDDPVASIVQKRFRNILLGGGILLFC